MSGAPVGVFDSGIGGLTVAYEISKLLPFENIIYFGDTERMPYGNESYETVSRYVGENIEFLNSMNAKMIVAACGTASAVISGLDFKFPKNRLCGIISSSCVTAVCATKNDRIGVMGTSVTISSNQYEILIKKINPQIQVFQKSCPLLAPMIESGSKSIESKNIFDIVESYVRPLLDFGIDTLILGCTHYSMIKNIISEIALGVNLIDPKKDTARFVCQYLAESGLMRSEKTLGKIIFFAGRISKKFTENAEYFFGKNIKINLTKIHV
jgi:glutamate racemase